jgi:hypothetical protein
MLIEIHGKKTLLSIIERFREIITLEVVVGALGLDDFSDFSLVL